MLTKRGSRSGGALATLLMIVLFLAVIVQNSDSVAASLLGFASASHRNVARKQVHLDRQAHPVTGERK